MHLSLYLSLSIYIYIYIHIYHNVCMIRACELLRRSTTSLVAASSLWRPSASEL